MLLFWGEAGIKDLLPLAMLLSNTYGEQGRAASRAAARRSSPCQPLLCPILANSLDAQNCPSGRGLYTKQQQLHKPAVLCRRKGESKTQPQTTKAM